MGRDGLRWLMVIAGAVAIVFGLLAVVTGTSLIPDAGAPSPNVDSELRFYAAWYVAAGVALVSCSRRPETAGATVRLICGALAVGASARVLSAITVGRPAAVFLVLTVVEYALAAVLWRWQAAAAKRAKQDPGASPPHS